MVLEARNEELDCQAMCITVDEEAFKRSTQWTHTDPKHGDWVLFRDLDNGSIAYLLVHGTPTGKMQIEDRVMTPEKWLLENAESLVEKGVQNVFTIACYGFTQQNLRYKGVSMQSLHTSCFEIYVETFERFMVVAPSDSMTGSPKIETKSVIRISDRIPSDSGFGRWFKSKFDKFVAYKYRLSPKKTRNLK